MRSIGIVLTIAAIPSNFPLDGVLAYPFFFANIFGLITISLSFVSMRAYQVISLAFSEFVTGVSVVVASFLAVFLLLFTFWKQVTGLTSGRESTKI